MAASTNLERFTHLLRELFQFDVADLDFGVYRILNEKRDDIERFIDNDLVAGVREELEAFEEGQREALEEKVEDARQAVLQNVSEDAVLPDGSVKEGLKDLGLSAVDAYVQARDRLDALELAEETEERIYDDLVRFFNRYYESGDFVTKRRFAAGDSKYYVPYDGEEVLLHWANRNQYYVKTTEHFRDYRFSIRDVDVHFKLIEAETPQDNVKASDTRYFVLQGEPPVTVDAESGTVQVRFGFRALTETEDEELLNLYNEAAASSRKTSDRSTIVVGTTEQILAKIEDATTRAKLAEPEGEKRPLEKHLNRYTAKHTADYFIHKDLSGFLKGQLSFYIQNEVLKLQDVLEASETRRVHQVGRARAVRKIGERIIDFLAQIENFQKRLFEKKKFVIETGYCVTIDQVPESLYDTILDSEAQLDEWKELYAIDQWEDGLFNQGYEDGTFTREFLEGNPHVMVDTRHFDNTFVDKLLAHLSDVSEEKLSEQVDGVCLNGENYQALRLLRERYLEEVDCIYIDPPYNTGGDGFLYKDAYKHSSWLSMMEDRLVASRPLMSNDALAFLSIDDIEQHVLRMLGSSIYGNFIANVIWQSRQSVDSRSETSLSNDHEFVLTYGKSLRGSVKDMEKFSNPDEDDRGPWRDADMTGLATEDRRPNLHFEMLIGVANKDFEPGSSFQVSGWEVQKPERADIEAKGELIEENELVLVIGSVNHDKKVVSSEFLVSLKGVQLLHVNGDSVNLNEPPYLFECPPKGWRYEPSSMAEKALKGRILIPNTRGGRLRHKLFRDEMDSIYKGFSSMLETVSPYAEKREGTVDPEVKVYTSHGTRELDSIFGEEVIQFPKPTALIKELVEQKEKYDSLVLDFFAGAGPTAQAVIELNRDDSESDRKYILIEVGDHFDSGLLPRIKKVTFAGEWSDGVPQSQGGISHVVQYHRLESYEDTLNNIKVEAPEGELDLQSEFGDYALQYMLDTETAGSDTLLTTDTFEKPFDDTLQIQHGMKSPTTHPVDLEATFNYLIGLIVQTRIAYAHQDRRYVVVTGTVEQEQSMEEVMVVWRDQDDLDLSEEKTWAAETLPEGPFDRVYVNGPSHIHGKAEPLEIVFRERMDPAAG